MRRLGVLLRPNAVRAYKRVPNMHVPQQLPGAPPQRIQPPQVPLPAAAAEAKKVEPKVSPAMCAMHLIPVADRRSDFEAWLSEGRELLAATLAEQRAPVGLASLHFVAEDGEGEDGAYISYEHPHCALWPPLDGSINAFSSS